MKEFDSLAPTAARLLPSLAAMESLSREQLNLYWENYKECVVGEAHGLSDAYKRDCPTCRVFAGYFADYARMVYHKVYTHNNSKYFTEYRLVLYNLVHQEPVEMIGDNRWGGGNGYTFDEQSFAKLKADFTKHMNEAHGK